MTVYTQGHSFNYECEKICRIYFPMEKIRFAQSTAASDSDSRRVFTCVEEQDGITSYYCRAEVDGKSSEHTVLSSELEETGGISGGEKHLAKAMVVCLSEITGVSPPWGILTGVRPSKLMRRLISASSSQKAYRIFTNDYLVSEEKAQLVQHVAHAQEEAVKMSGEKSFSLYISVPFCPTRCSYCSFVSHSIASAKKLLPEYVRLLCREIRFTAEIAQRAGLKLETVYIGGGTPTVLSASELSEITNTINTSFNMNPAREFTVEAGRPDTIDAEKLTVLKEAGVTRISINPQTFNDSVLRNIGRPHTGKDAEEKFFLARSLGFDSINTDFIAGLPGDTPESFAQSIEKALSLSPENITVHTLALKRSASIVTENETDSVSFDTLRMVSFANSHLPAGGYHPYYMYRQSKCVGNLENVGWSKPGFDCLYNIFMMEELHTVLACGGGAVTKLCSHGGETVERIYNFKYPYEYIGRFEEQLERKKQIEAFYSKLQS